MQLLRVAPADNSRALVSPSQQPRLLSRDFAHQGLSHEIVVFGRRFTLWAYAPLAPNTTAIRL
jgi:hypothetical protein